MSLRSEIASLNQKIVLDVIIGGTRARNVYGADVSLGLSQVNARATLLFTSRPPRADEGASCEVWAGYNGKTAQLFKGEIVERAWDYAPGVVSVGARDLLARTRLNWAGADRTYTNEDDAAVIRNLLEAMGIPSTVARIVSSEWTLAVAQDLIAKKGEAFWRTIAEIDELAGYKTYTTSDGVIHRERVSALAAGTASFEYQKGINIIRARRTISLDGIANFISVDGLEYEDVPCHAEAVDLNPYIPTPPGTIAKSVQSDLIETPTKAQEIANRMLYDNNRRPEGMELEVFGNPLLQPRMTLHVVHSDLEVGDAYLLIDSVSHSIRKSSYRTSLRTLGGGLGSGVPEYPPEIACDGKFFLEAEDTGEGGIAQKIVGVLDASATTDPDGDETLITFAWTLIVDVGTVTPTSASGPLVRCVIDGAATKLTATITATDSDGNSSELAREFPLDPRSMLVEDLWTAEGSLLVGSFDGEQSWVEQPTPSGDATCLAAFAPSWGQVWGTDDGHVYATFDKLVTVVDLGAPHGAVACTALWVNEQDETRLWAGFDDGKVAFGTIDIVAFTATWALKGDVGVGPINEIRESYGTLNELRATASTVYHYSTDGGVTWTDAHVFSGTAWRMAAGFDQNLVGALDDDSPLYGETLNPTVPSGVRHLRGLAFGWKVQELYAADDTAQLMRSDEALTALAVTSSAPVGINHIVRSGNVDGVVYLAGGDGTGGNSGALKSLRMDTPWYIRRTDDRIVHMVGYGAAHAPILTFKGELLIVDGGPGCQHPAGVWHYKDGAWTHKTTGLPDVLWRGIAADPTNPDRWLIWDDAGGHNIWITEDAGASWSQTDVNLGGGTSGLGQTYVADAVFSATVAGEWTVSGVEYNAGDFGTTRARVYRGSGTAITSEVVGVAGSLHDSTAGYAPTLDIMTALVDGHSGTTIAIGYSFTSTWPIATYTIPVTASLSDESDIYMVNSTGGPPPVGDRINQVDRFPGSHTLVVAFNNPHDDAPFAWIVDDTELEGPFQFTLYDAEDAGSNWVAATADGSAWVGKQRGATRLWRITGLTDTEPTPVREVITAFNGSSIIGVRSDRQSQTVVAVMAEGNPTGVSISPSGDYMAVWDGTAWAYVLGPLGASMHFKYARRFEVIAREVV